MDTEGFLIIAVGLVAFSLVSRRLSSTIVTGPMIFVVFGLAIGGAGLGVIDLNFDHEFIHGLAEVTLILVLFSDAARIDVRVLRHDHTLPQRMLLIGMPLGIAIGTAVTVALPLGLTFWEAALLAAILTPTDAALGQSVVSSPLVPMRIRQAINVESGLNDGIALPVVLLFACFASANHTGSGAGPWLVFGMEQVILGPIAGIVIGGLGAWLIDRAAKSEWMEESIEGAAILALAFLAYAGAEAIGGNGFIAAFVAGLTFGAVVRTRCVFILEFAEAEGQLLTLITFLIVGAAILPEALHGVDMMMLLYAGLSLTVVRMIPIAVSLMGSGVKMPTMGFLGWFGPRGLASLLFALLVLEDAELANPDRLLTLVVITVAISIVAHGMSAAPLSKVYGRFATGMGDCPETDSVSPMPLKGGATSRSK